MSTPYYCDLFYEDIGFTNDYSNVLQFNSKADREAYFDNIAHYHMEYTEFNNMNVTGNSIKIAFYDIQSVDLDEINYLRIATRLYGTSTTLDTLEYGFVIDYDVLSSAEDCTVVQFIFEKDIWMNYQFNFELRECNVERSHMDRWDEDGNIIYTRPSYDGLDSYMKEYKTQKLSRNFTHLWHRDDIGYGEDIEVTEKLAFVFITYLKPAQDTSPEKIEIYCFPVSLGTTNNIYPFHIATYKVATQGYHIGDAIACPTMREIVDGTIANYLGLDANRIVNMQIVYDLSVNITTTQGSSGSTFHFTTKIETPSGLIFASSWIVNPNFNTHGCYVVSGSSLLNYQTSRLSVEYEYEKSLPVLPVDGDDYSETHELMLYKSPVLKRYITNYDGSVRAEIPDINIEDNTFTVTSFISNISAYNLITLNNELSASSIINFSATIPSLGGDVISNAWQNYVMEYRNTDRELMWTNIATMGMADAGSTGISAGIGYRANQERAEMANIQRSMVDGRTKYGRSLKAESQMYSGFAKQAAGMSLIGGGVQFAANAIGTYMAQEIKEKSIKNTPGSLAHSGDATSYFLSNVDENLVYNEVICDEESYKQYADIFKKFGYAIYGVITPNIKSRKYFNYIKTAGAILTGNVNQSILANLAVLFDKGMTIWHMDYTTKATLYDYTKENIERSLM